MSRTELIANITFIVYLDLIKHIFFSRKSFDDKVSRSEKSFFDVFFRITVWKMLSRLL